MNAQELFLGDGRSAGVWYCGDCKIVARTQDDAQRCCAPRLCECGVELTGSDKHYTRCSACRYADQERRDLAQFNAATKVYVEDYTGEFVYIDGEDAPISFDCLEDWFDEQYPDAVTRYVYGADPEQPTIDVDAVIEHALEDTFDGAESHISAEARKELTDYVAQWCAANMPTVYYANFKTALVPWPVKG